MKFKNLFMFAALMSASSAYAVPVLQIGPDVTDANYNTDTDTWDFLGGGEFSFNLYNLSDIDTVYLVFAAAPMTTAKDFDIVVNNDGSVVAMSSSGVGAPPSSDSNALAPHGIYDTYFETYAITFNGGEVTVPNTQPGSVSDCSSKNCLGRVETIDVDVLSTAFGLNGIHIDAFTMDAEGQVINFAPFSHDGEYVVPVPAAVWLFGSGLLGLVGVARRKSRA